MKIKFRYVGILMLLLFFIPEVKSQEEAPYLEITSPTANTVWYLGDVVTITWETNVEADTVRIVVGNWRGHEIMVYEVYGESDITNDGVFSFKLPLETPTGADWFVDVLIVGADNDASPNFTITTKPPVDYTIWIILAVALGLIGIFSILFYVRSQNRILKKEIEILKQDDQDRTEQNEK